MAMNGGSMNSNMRLGTAFGLKLVSLALFAMFFAWGATPSEAQTKVTAFMQSVAESAARDKDLAAFYKVNGYKPIWVGRTGRDRARREAFIWGVKQADLHGLPRSRYQMDDLVARMRTVKGQVERGRLEVELSRTFLRFARDMQTGVLVPSKIDSNISRAVPYRERVTYLTNFVKSNPRGFIKALPPKAPEYARLMKEKLTLEKRLAKGGWGQKVPAKSLKPGATGNAVVILRNRLMAMGFLKRTATNTYDANVQAAVQQFQLAHGLATDGVAGAGTMAEINKGVEDRLKSIIVAMERERWMNLPRGKRHVLVNIPDFTARIIDNDKVTFKTIAVVGKNDPDRRTPEFSDVMEFMVINPSWYVPRSIATKEYLPMLKKNPNAVNHLELTDARGKKVNRGAVNFASFTEKSFPFNMRQPPSRGNALGLVKFMFPNKHNIYLHDTPAKKLFAREKRDFSHGCIRLHQPFEFAYALLAKQTNDPQGFFKARLDTGRESRVNLAEPVPVHLIYRTAFTQAKGRTQYRRDVYGQDAKIFNALSKAGVVLRAVRG